MLARRVVNAEFRLRAPDGGWRWTNVLATPLLDTEGKIEKWLGLNIDIDARKLAEASLRESEGRYRSLFESMDEAYAVVEVLRGRDGRWADFRFLEVNQAFLKHTTMPWPVGKTATELLGSPTPRWTELYGQALDTGQPLRVEETEPTLDLTFDLNIFSLDPDLNRVAVLFTDITDRKKSEITLRENEERLSLAIEVGRFATWDWDLRSGKVSWNERHFILQGYKVGEVTPSFEAWLARVHPDDRAETLALIAAAREAQTIYVHDFRTLQSDGTSRWVTARGRFFYDDRHGPYRMIGVMEDVTGHKLAEAFAREDEVRQKFLLRFSDALRPLAQAAEIIDTASRLLAEHVGASRAMYS